MAEIRFTCPWCSSESTCEIDLNVAILTNEDQVRAVIEKKKDELGHRFFRCEDKRKDCPAPIEVIVCGNLDLARKVQGTLSGSWSVPTLTRFPLPLSDAAQHTDTYIVQFNSSNVEQPRVHRLDHLFDEDLLRKLLLGVASSHDMPIVLFEGCPLKNEVVWQRIPAEKTMGGHVPYQYNRLCQFCRDAFRKRLDRDLLRTPCDYGKNCPSPERDADGNCAGNIDLCPHALKLREKYSLCHASDMKAVRSVMAKYEQGKNKPPYELFPCWRGCTELAFPIEVHGYLSAVALTGQFLVEQPLPEAKDVIAAEREKRKNPSDCILCKKEKELERLLKNKKRVPILERGKSSGDETCFIVADTQAQVRKVADKLHKVIEHIEEVASNRYLQEKERREAAFRAELSGRLLRNLIDGEEFPAFLPLVLKRMLDFWAFESAALLMGSEVEQNVKLYAIAPGKDGKPEYLENLAKPVVISGQTDFAESERGDLVAPRHGRSESPLTDPDLNLPLLDELERQSFISQEKQTFIVRVKRASRVYIFVFNGRNLENLSRLPYRKPKDGTRLSNEAQLHIRTTCQYFAEGLYHFWYRRDLELTYAALLHSLRTPITIMRKPINRFERLLKKHREILERVPDDFLSWSLNRVVEGAKVGAEAARDELQKLRSADSIEERLVNATDGITDLADILRALRKRYDFIGSAYDKTWEQHGVQHGAFVRAQRGFVWLALQNVIDNAYKYSLPNKEITVRLWKDKSKWILAIQNFGVAIGDDEISRIGHKGYRGFFARTAKIVDVQGTGLGIYIVQKICSALNGEFSISSVPSLEEGKGYVTVEIHLPSYTVDERK